VRGREREILQFRRNPEHNLKMEAAFPFEALETKLHGVTSQMILIEFKKEIVPLL
jgi:hypothetical protein